MAILDDQPQLRQALLDATLGQPEAPADRLAGVHRRHVRRRIAQGAIAAAATIAVVAGAVTLSSPFGRTAAVPANQSVPSWALPWSDHRDGAVPRRVLDGAVTAWRHFASSHGLDVPLPKAQRVIWYVGNYAADRQAIAVVFEVDTGSAHRLVGGWATASEVDHGQPAWDASNSSSPWVIYDVPAPNPKTFHGVVGLNVHGESADPGVNPDNWVVLLGPPAGTSAHIAFGGTRPLDHGFGVFDLGQLTETGGPIEASIRAGSGRWPAGGNIGIPGAPASRVPQLAAVPPLTRAPVASLRVLDMSAGQGDSVTSDMSFRHTGPTTVYARCRGGGTIRVAVDSDRADAGVSIRCDDAEHAVAGPPLRAHNPYGQGHSVSVHAGEYTSWRVAVVADR